MGDPGPQIRGLRVAQRVMQIPRRPPALALVLVESHLFGPSVEERSHARGMLTPSGLSDGPLRQLAVCCRPDQGMVSHGIVDRVRHAGFVVRGVSRATT